MAVRRDENFHIKSPHLLDQKSKLESRRLWHRGIVCWLVEKPSMDSC